VPSFPSCVLWYEYVATVKVIKEYWSDGAFTLELKETFKGNLRK
jgi:hypothetical protein